MARLASSERQSSSYGYTSSYSPSHLSSSYTPSYSTHIRLRTKGELAWILFWRFLLVGVAAGGVVGGMCWGLNRIGYTPGDIMAGPLCGGIAFGSIAVLGAMRSDKKSPLIATFIVNGLIGGVFGLALALGGILLPFSIIAAAPIVGAILLASIGIILGIAKGA